MALLITVIAILVATNAVTEAVRAQYKVVLKTADVSRAGTDKWVYMTIEGSDGSTKERGLDVPGKNDMQAGETDTHNLPLEDVGIFECVKFRIKGWTDGWMPEEIQIYKNGKLVYNSGKVNIWLDDSKTLRFCKDNAPRRKYRIFIKTAGDYGAGTDNWVYMRIKGDRGQEWSNEVALDVPNKNDMMPNSIDMHEFFLEDVGHIECVEFRIKGKDQWKVKQVLVYSLDSDTRPIFDSGELDVWLDNYETKAFCQ